MASETTRYGDLCRLCATKTSIVHGINIFESEGATRQINKKIETCLPIQVHEADELPKMICEHCLYKLELFFAFRERTLRTETLLVDLFKEINAEQVQNDHEQQQLLVKMSESMDVVSVDHTDLIMVHHQLLNDHTIPNVGQIDLLAQRNGLIVEHEIVLTQQNVDMNSHSLDTIELNHHELTSQDLSNHSLQTQDSILVGDSDAVHTIQNAQFTEENLELLHQQQQIQLLTEQYRLQQGLCVMNNITTQEEKSPILKQNLNDSESIIQETAKLAKNLDIKMGNTSVITNTQVNGHERTYNAETEVKADTFKDEDSSSKSSLLIDDSFNEINENDGHILLMQGDKNCDVQEGNQERDYFYCNMCGKSFMEKNIFEEHYEQHFNKCDLCLAVFTTKETLNSHRKEVHGSSMEEPKQIKTRLKRATVPIKKNKNEKDNTDSDSEECAGEELNDQVGEEEEEEEYNETNHIESNSKKKKWSPKICKECGKSYKTNYKLTEHMRKHTGEKPYKCSSCEKAFRSKIGLAQHEAKHTGQYDFSCPTCGKGFQCKSYLMVHQRVHSDIKPYPCTTCGRNFKTKQSLLDHTNRHLGVKPYMCDTCGRGFITKGLCKAHQKVHTGLDNRKYSCKICNKMFVSKSYLQTHLRIHTGEKPFICEVCGKGFLTRVDLRIHSTVHTGEKSYVCEMCGKAFARRDALRCHRRSHTGERPYSCDQCGQTFTQFSPMAIHKRLHTGERPYACEVCGKTFVSKSTMMAHSKKHVR